MKCGVPTRPEVTNMLEKVSSTFLKLRANSWVPITAEDCQLDTHFNLTFILNLKYRGIAEIILNKILDKITILMF